MLKRCLWVALISLTLYAVPVEAQDEPVVYAVLFYSPTCPHCHQVIQNDLPPLQEQYSEQLQILFVNVTTQAGQQMFLNACTALEVPRERCGSVPMMVAGSKVMVGSGEIPAQLPGLIENGLKNGGIGLPAIPGLQEAYDAMVEREQTASQQTSSESSSAVQGDAKELSWQERFEDDLFANGLAVLILLLLIASVAITLVSFYRAARENRQPQWLLERPGWYLTLLAALMCIFIAGSLVLEQENFSTPTLLAAGITGILMLVAGTIWTEGNHKKHYTVPDWILPAVTIAGLLVAGYMVYVEVGENEAVCGAVGNCNLVQQSEYAEFLGLIPIGVIGIAGYVAILGAWLLTHNPHYAARGQKALFWLILIGTVFSIYLTFLEPFVIGTVCAWCLTSATVMILLLWLQAPAGIKTYKGAFQ